MVARRMSVSALLLPALLAPRIAGAEGEVPNVARILAEAKEPVRVVGLGDSIMGVYYHTGGRRAWPEMLGIALGRLYPKARVEVTNAGISGDTTAGALARLDRDVLSRKSHLVVVMFGMNDTARVPVETYRENPGTIVRRCRTAEAAARSVVEAQDIPRLQRGDGDRTPSQELFTRWLRERMPGS